MEVKLLIQTASASAQQQLDHLQHSGNNTDLQHLIQAQGVLADAVLLPASDAPPSCARHAVGCLCERECLLGMHPKIQLMCPAGLQTTSLAILGSSVGANAAPTAAPVIAAAATLAQPPMQVPAQAPDTPVPAAAAAAAAAGGGGGAATPAAGVPAQVLHASVMPAAIP